MSTTLDQRSRELRVQIIETLLAGNRGHLCSAFSLVEIIRVLYDCVLRIDPGTCKDTDRDRFILSKGHGCLALYVVLCEKGFFSKDELQRFCHPEGLLGGHPEHRIPGVEASTGSLGHGVCIATGMALSAKMDRSSRKIVSIIGDGESNEGTVWEAALFAGKHQLDNFTLCIDYNKKQSYASTREVLDLEPLADKWRAFGFAVDEVDGHDVAALKEVFLTAKRIPRKPRLLICHTVKGRGISEVEGDLSWHHVNKLNKEKAQALIHALRHEP